MVSWELSSGAQQFQERSFLDPDNLRQVVEMPVSCVQDKIVLKDQGGKPHVIGWNWRALFPELPEHGRIMVRGLIVGKEHAYAFLH